MREIDELEWRAGLFNVACQPNATVDSVRAYCAACPTWVQIATQYPTLVEHAERIAEARTAVRDALRTGATQAVRVALHKTWQDAFQAADAADRHVAEKLFTAIRSASAPTARITPPELFPDRIPRTPGPLVVSIGRDPALLLYSLASQGGILVTTNSFQLADRRIRVISFQEYLEEHGFAREHLRLYDTDLMHALDNPEQPDVRSHVPEEYRPHLVAFRSFVVQEIVKEAHGDHVIVNPYHSTGISYWQSLGYTVLGPSEYFSSELALKYNAWDLARSIGIHATPGAIVRGKALVEKMLATFGSVFVSSQDNAFHPMNMRIRSNTEIDAHIRDDVQYLVTKWLSDTVASPNTQAIVGDHDEQYLGANQQALRAHTQYDGNVWPLVLSGANAGINMQLELLTMRYAAKLREMGYRGVFGIDWVVAPDPQTGRMEAFFVELNPRENRSTVVQSNLLGVYNSTFSFFDLKVQSATGESVQVPNLRTTFDSIDGQRTLYARMIPFKPAQRVRLVRTPELRTEMGALMCAVASDDETLAVGTIENLPLDGTVLDSDKPHTMRIVVYGWKLEVVEAEAERIRNGFFDGYIPTGAVVRTAAEVEWL